MQNTDSAIQSRFDQWLTEFHKLFQHFALLEPVAAFIYCRLWEEVDVDSFLSKRANAFHLEMCIQAAVEDEILTLQADIQLRSRTHGQFWNLFTEEKYPNMRKCATSLTALFG